MPLYDSIGRGYATTLPADPRIVEALIRALRMPAGATLLDVGAGTGKYARALADRGFDLIAIEPSAVMRAQGAAYPRVRVITASAEAIPLPDDSADAAFVVLALHHFGDRAKALREILRVIGRGPLVVFTFEPGRLGEFWLADYFPRLGREIDSSFSKLDDVAGEIKKLTGREVHVVPFPLPSDLMDMFAAALWASPERYLRSEVRNGISSFSLMAEAEVEAGLRRLADDLKSGAWDSRHGALRELADYDAGYRFIVATVD
jgi:ubiquinone/menaquinone biosynthesis C-methylase UbiE